MPIFRKDVQHLARLTVVDKTYHQSRDGQPVLVESSFARQLSTDEQPYSRRMRINSAWQPVDRGWLSSASMLIITHQGKVEQVSRPGHPSGTVEVGINTGLDRVGVIRVLLIRPGESARFTPHDLSSIRLRSLSGEGEPQVTITIIPE